MKENKLLYKILGILLLLGGVFFIGLSLVDFYEVVTYNQNALPGELRETKILWSIIAAPLTFSGFFFFILGFGKKKTHE